MSIKETVKQILINRENRAYEKELFCKKSNYHEWVKWDEQNKKVTFSGKPTEYVIWMLAGGKLSKEARTQYTGMRIFWEVTECVAPLG